MTPPIVELRQPLVPAGFAFKSWKPMHWLGCSWEHGLEFVPQFWLNPDDLGETVCDPPDYRGLNGCCGPAGLDGPNQICRRCKASVGTLQDDCSTPRVFIPHPQTTTWVEGTDEFWNY